MFHINLNIVVLLSHMIPGKHSGAFPNIMRHNSSLNFGHVKFHCLHNDENELELEFYFKFIFSVKERIEAVMLNMKKKVSLMPLKDGQRRY